MSRLFNSLFPFADFVYILQLEEYSTRRYLKWLPHFFLRRHIQERQQLIYTPRATLILALSLILFAIAVGFGFLVFTEFGVLIFLVILPAFVPVFVVFSNGLLQPLFALLHSRARTQAAKIIASRRSSMRIVMVAGSYGKTTTKSFIEQLTKHQFRVQVPPGNINTPSGIASWIVRELQSTTTLLIIESDGYSKDEYIQTCAMVPADIAVITNIGDQHLERFGTREALKEALAEVFSRTTSDGHVITTTAVAVELKDSVGSRDMHAVAFLEQLHYRGILIDVPQLSASARDDLALALTVADVLGVAERFVKDASHHLAAPDRRQAHGALFGYEAIDDSYNISFSTASASLIAAREMAKKEGKKLLVVTAGIPELGPNMRDGNKKLGEMLRDGADHIVVLSSIFVDEIVAGLGQAEHTVMSTLKEFETLAHTQFKPQKWFLLLLPELNDLYY